MSFQIDYEVLLGVYMQAQHNVPHPNALGATHTPPPASRPATFLQPGLGFSRRKEGWVRLGLLTSPGFVNLLKLR